jgi:hypothetical protein
MPNQLRARDISDWTGTVSSMARAIELEMEKEVAYGPNELKLGRQRLALAIARGVLHHLKDNQGAFTVRVPHSTSTQTIPVDINIDVI